MRDATEARQRGFTLIELLIVITIIGIIISLVLVAASDGIRRAEERATQALIQKLDTAINDRLDALLNTTPPINQTHRYIGAITYSDGTNYVPTNTGTGVNSDDRRAAVIAQFDYLRAELPDVFFVNALCSDGGTVVSSYPINFCGAPYPAGTNGVINFVLPLGNTFPGLPLDPPTATNLVPNGSSNYTPPTITGIFGASFSAAGGIYKQLGYAKKGYDGVDNDNNGYPDELSEGVPAGSTLVDFTKQVTTQLAKHTHKTARSEMLYALLVEGLSPLGSSFGPDDFTAREVQDTDGDGLMEFVDAWGEPLQFYRWPLYYGTVPGSSDSQLGSSDYEGSFSQPREQDPLDGNQLLVSPAWWSTGGNPALTTPAQSSFAAPGPTTAIVPPYSATNPASVSQNAMAFMNYFHSLVDARADAALGNAWDRGGAFTRRAYLSRFLILSGGPDKEPGVGRFDRDYSDNYVNGSGLTFPFPAAPNATPSITMQQAAQYLILIENQAGQSDPNPTARSGAFFEVPAAGASSTTSTTSFLIIAAGDDISNHNIQGVSTGVR